MVETRNNSDLMITIHIKTMSAQWTRDSLHARIQRLFDAFNSIWNKMPLISIPQVPTYNILSLVSFSAPWIVDFVCLFTLCISSVPLSFCRLFWIAIISEYLLLSIKMTNFFDGFCSILVKHGIHIWTYVSFETFWVNDVYFGKNACFSL